MEITEVRVRLLPSRGDRLQAFCSVTLSNEFVIRDVKVIEGTKGPFVAMPSRKLTDRCSSCGGKNHLKAKYCNECGLKLGPARVVKDAQGRPKLHVDIAHPINSECRKSMQDKILDTYLEHLRLSQQPGYVPPKYEELDDFPEVEVPESDFKSESAAEDDSSLGNA